MCELAGITIGATGAGQTPAIQRPAACADAEGTVSLMQMQLVGGATVDITVGTFQDQCAANDLDAQLFGDDSWAPERITQWWDAKSIKLIVARHNGTLVGYAYVLAISMDAYNRITSGAMSIMETAISDADPTSEHWMIGGIGVEPTWQQQGIGQIVSRELRALLVGKVCTVIWSEAGRALTAKEAGWHQTHQGEHTVWERIEQRQAAI